MDTRAMEAYAAQLKKITERSDEMMERVADKVAMGFIRTAKQETPVKTGNLRRSWDVDGIDHKGYRTDVTVINPVEYAEYVDKGHRAGKSGWVEGRYMTDKGEEAVERNAERWARPIINSWLGGVMK